jgi:predicted AAA+ superfamily ATPase
MLLLGSASPDLLKQTSESLAGRIAYIDLTPFLLYEIDRKKYRKHWIRGGFPDSYLAEDDDAGMVWRQNFVRTYLEQDIPALGFNISTQTVRRLWTMLAHTSGQVVNFSRLSQALGISPPTVKSYINILQKTYMVRVLHPYFSNIKKRLVKSPKIYIRDTGIMHFLLGIETMDSLFGHPLYGNSWESYALEQVCAKFKNWTPFFFRTAKGTEIDLILKKGNQKVAVEFKASAAPKVTRGFYNALEYLDVDDAFIIAPLLTDESYSIGNNITVTTLSKLKLT